MPDINPLITLNGVSLSSSQVSEYTLTYNKLWKNADRNMDGRITASLIGVYPNISVTTGILSFSKAQQLSEAINDDFFYVTYWDTQTGSHKTAQYYAADHDVKFLNECKYGQVTVEIVAVDKATYI